MYFGEKYKELREAYRAGNFDKTDYCKHCDFLQQRDDVLAWSNNKNAKLNNMLGRGDEFILTEFNKNKMST